MNALLISLQSLPEDMSLVYFKVYIEIMPIYCHYNANAIQQINKLIVINITTTFINKISMIIRL